MKKCMSALIVMLVIFAPIATFANDYPSHTKDFYVNDFAGILSQETKNEVMTTSVPLAQETGAQIVVVTLESLEGQDIESYSRALFVDWGIGDADKENGVLLLIAMDENLARIEVGYGLEGALNDAKTGRIQDDYLIGNFAEGNYDAGVLGTYLKLAEEVYAEYALDAEAIGERNVYSNSSADEEGSTPSLIQIIFGFFVVVLIILDLIFNRGRLTRLIIYVVARNSKGSSGGGFGGGGGRSGGGGSTRGW